MIADIINGIFKLIIFVLTPFKWLAQKTVHIFSILSKQNQKEIRRVNINKSFMKKIKRNLKKNNEIC